ncbi:probable translation factor pelota, related [Neospora caninum Liverpool]|uniref:Protein pelota homolog n=1 Tax=Neospora caninum (strain Liverpool) TaxID=572307 RepID=F0V9I0_NEOCL|nr:probable translation factor pelota, related [Neospora caninum Liverpool]CBZ50405.1 probable translation factor pelota, related [Neospora caninum Liverpool]|eukprot:XP_003880439.1 probable translation factor pelota, related [Neospora caninum Liverpool]
MKLMKQNYERDGSGSIVCECEVADDVWTLYNIVLPGDKVKCVTTRKLQKESDTGAVSSEVKKIVLNILVKKIDYEGDGDVLRISGQVVEENPYVKIGSYHTLDISLHTKFTLYKEQWDRLFLDRLQEAVDPHRSAEVQVVLIESGLCHIFLLSSSLAKPVAKVTAAMPKQRGHFSNYEKVKRRFFEDVFSSLFVHTNPETVKCVLIAGPGFVKDEFLRFLHQEAVKRQALTELLADPSVLALLENTKAARHAQRLQDFYKLLNKTLDASAGSDCRNLTCYGPTQVATAVEVGAVASLLITDGLLRSSNTTERRRFVRLVEEVERAGGEVLTFSDQHTSGEQLNMLSGVAAILKFPIDDFLEEDEDSGDETRKRES